MTMADVRYVTCSSCSRTTGANLGSQTLKVGICKMCREDPHWLDRYPDVRKAIARSKGTYPSIGLRFKHEKRDPAKTLSFETFSKDLEAEEEAIKQGGAKVEPPIRLPKPATKSGKSAKPSATHSMGSKENPMGVRIGQKWRSLDKRERGTERGDRFVLIKGFTDDYIPRAIVDSFWEKDGTRTSPMLTRILKFSTFVPTKGRGFELVDGSFTQRSNSSSRNPYGVAVGQVWRRLDSRASGTFLIEEVDEENGTASYKDRAGNLRAIKLDRFTKDKRGRGYVLESF